MFRDPLNNNHFVLHILEVARTRLREEGSKYRKLWQTLALVAQEEGWRGLYRGLGTQLIRQIPNTAIMMATYELTVYLFTKYFPSSSSDSTRIDAHVEGYDTFEVSEAPDPTYGRH